jgi:hypothetical protein
MPLNALCPSPWIEPVLIMSVLPIISFNEISNHICLRNKLLSNQTVSWTFFLGIFSCYRCTIAKILNIFLLVTSIAFGLRLPNSELLLKILCNGTARFRNLNNCLITNIYSNFETSGGQSLNLYLSVFIYSTPVLIRYPWQLKTIVFQHWCLIQVVLIVTLGIKA